ncbi:cytochrome c1 [Erythrobacter litoralis]|uniref:Cytochrome c1 n=1 Tax=Erythrobacter litoralis (strain HTCC2594) TaxID=314225 RepID=Q2N670_ERYLH|nr:cytochrome c1 [Erythrobacter litoralis]ABC64821.1 Cytochrome c1, heme protein precursor [Erythrobacter litoralis HTCC2594]
MIRLFSIAAGLVFTLVVMIAFGVGAYTAATEEVVKGPEKYFHLENKTPAGGWSFDGPLGRWDVAQLQRGLKVYDEVCSACHGLKFVAFRNLAEIGFDEGQVKNYAAAKQVPGIDPNTGEATTRAGLPTDYFPDPYPNDVAAAAANNNAIPPDLSLITKARKDGSNYVYSLLSGYGDPPAELAQQFPDFNTPPGLYFNRYFKYLNIAMPPQLTPGQVTYDDGTEATVEQMSADVAAFLTWTAEPKMQQRKQTGWAVIGFLLFATILAYLAKQQIWSAVKPKKAK